MTPYKDYFIVFVDDKYQVQTQQGIVYHEADSEDAAKTWVDESYEDLRLAMTEQGAMIVINNFNGSLYQIKEHLGLRFASMSLHGALFTGGDEPVSDTASEIDDMIAFYYDDDQFINTSAEELHRKYELFDYLNQ